MKLYEINRSIERILDEAVDRETGEFLGSAEVEVALGLLEVNKNEKVLDIAAYMKGVDAEAAAIKAEADILYKRQKSLDKKVEWLKDYLGQNIEQGEKFKDARSSISWRASKAVLITDDEALPDKFWIVKREISKSKIGDSLRAGEVVPGAQFEERMNIVIK